MIINGKRELAYIAKIKKITPIEGYDRVELAKINGWNVIVKKGDFEKGDLCVYFEVDSKVPNNDKRFDFLKSCNFKIKTKKVCGTYSQGLAMPISFFPEIDDLRVGVSLTEKLGITHIDYQEDSKRYSKFSIWKKFVNYLYDKNILKDKKDFPYDLVNKTDEERIENIKIERISGGYHATEKLDGTSATYILKRKIFGYEFIICSRNRRLSKRDKNKDIEKYYYIANKYQIKNKLKHFFIESSAKKYVGVQGEIIGEGIQGNPLEINGKEFYVFNIIRDYEENDPYDNFYGERINLPKVPSIGRFYTNRAVADIFFYFSEKDFSFPKENVEWKKIAEINSLVNPNKKAEGIVFRSPIPKKIKESNNFIYSFKNINNSYLVKK